MSAPRKFTPRSLSNLAIMVVFGGYIFYHASVALIGLPRFIGGYFTPLVLILAATIFFFNHADRALKINKVDVAFFCLMFFMLTLSVAYRLFGDFNQSREPYFLSMVTSLTVFIGTYILVKHADFNSKIFQRYLTPLLLIQCAIIISFGIIDGQFLLSGLSSDDTLKVAGYQQIGMVLAFQLGLLMSTTRTFWSFLLFLFGLLALYYNGARSEFVAFLLAGSWLLSASLAKRYRFLVYPAILAALIVMVFGFITFVSAGSRLDSISQIFLESSYIARADMTNWAIRCIQSSPFIGCYGEDTLIGEGSYSHNWLSAWHTFGVVAFLGMIYIFFGNLLFLIRRRMLKRRDALFAIYYVITAIFMMTFSKHFLDVVFAISLALMSQLMNNIKFPDNIEVKSTT